MISKIVYIFEHQISEVMKFIKIHIPADNINPESIQWRLLLETVEDVLIYQGCDIERMTMALLYDTTDKDDPKTVKLKDSIQTLCMGRTANNGKGEIPIFKLAEVIDRKTAGMIRMITEHGYTLMVNEAGGYTTLDTLTTWKATVLETLQKSDLGFPVDNDVLKSEFLILENQDTMPFAVAEYIKENQIGNYAVLNNVVRKDLAYVVGCINNAKTIAIQSEFDSPEQIELYMRAFAGSGVKEDRKIIIFTINPERITEHHLYAYNDFKHDITIHKL